MARWTGRNGSGAGRELVNEVISEFLLKYL